MVDKNISATVTTVGSVPGIAGVSAGKTVVVDAVVAKIAGIAAREVPGVYAVGGGAQRAIGAIRDAIGNTDLSQGVRSRWARPRWPPT